MREAGVATVGEVPRELPALLMPQLHLVAQMWPAAAGIALMSFAETIAVGRAFAAPGEPRPAPNRELLATGLASAAGGLVGALPAGGGATQTAVNRRAGAKSQLAALVTAAVALATLLLLAPLIALMPQAALAAVVVASSLELIKPAEFRAIRRVRAVEFRWALVAFAGVIFLGTLQGILVAVIVSLLALAQQAYNPPVHIIGRKRGTDVFRPRSDEHPDDETWPGLLILRPEGRLFFANAPRVAETIRPHDRPGEARGRAARLPRGARHRVHRAQDAHRGRRAAARRGHRAVARGLQSARCWRWCATRSSASVGRERMFFNVAGGGENAMKPES